ncbi:MAG TPA: helix-turn-helix domain-containing GNAT family N-acetyltransferase [Streptosporangiales bacterium]
MDVATVAQVRRFNRTVTRRVGALQDHFLGRDRPLGAARLLWEIGADAVDVRTLRARLGLDSGYVSRLLRSLEADGLVTVTPDESDRRVRIVRATDAGVAERRALDEQSDSAATALLDPLTPRQRERLVAAMADVERLLRLGMVEIAEADPREPDARHCLLAYFAELDERFDGGFDAAAAAAAADTQFRRPAGMLLVARLDGEPVGCAGMLYLEDGSCYVKRMWVAPQARGIGLARRFLAELEAHAAARGAGTVRLETHRALTEAIRLYRGAGYVEVPPFNHEPYAHHWFEKRIEPVHAE